ncbi:precorrin-6Y C5,15-methyltransferase (decarboxylating) subunit CbiT [Clostridium ganghwense]|uniref:Precorrin-6Y C5,15-methyltransferase (Decarboxylating) subunit CbiT n=1 Tax=Clostridium ganghwense TaxID=312089 RepID=A0ABT4CSW6_9CLOT|nr:precorrin-6Y C5,15-methyltransferase (decarboxylating) subunit CbiT [Clostridium ganghwense]MCY6372171.1 precorrin-6Y C5,15-methyltransferase (decarboxylating) subunit CbiT [Clostridium ganghwense]
MIYIKDEEFIRGNCPMTKEEVRILSVAKMELREEDRVLDIGAGTGSISIQMSKICRDGSVIAVERDKEAIEVLYKNKEKFQADNLEIIEGEALEAESKIEGSFDGIFIGGSGGNIEEIIKKYSLKLKKGRKIVLNFITIDNLYKAMNTLRQLEFEVECTQVSISKTKGKSYMLFANNPIFILSGRK